MRSRFVAGVLMTIGATGPTHTPGHALVAAFTFAVGIWIWNRAET